MNIPKFAISNYQFTLVAFLFLLIMGIVSFLNMPQREDPVLDIPNTVILAVYPGASPLDLESQVTDPIEDVISELDDIRDLRTFVWDGVSVTNVEFNFGTDSDKKYDEVQRQLNSIRNDLPPGLFELDVRKITTSTVSIFQIAFSFGYSRI